MSLCTRNIKSPGIIEPPRSEDLVSTQRFQVSTSDKEFILIIFETHGSFTLYLGSVDAQLVKTNIGVEDYKLTPMIGGMRKQENKNNERASI